MIALTGVTLLIGLWSPVVIADCPTRDLTPIAALKGAAGAARDGEQVRVRGIVTGDFRGEDRLRGFFLQSATVDRDGLPSGIFVFAPDLEPAAPPLAPGIEVVVTATAGEFRGQRQLSRVDRIQACAEPGLPTAVALPFPPAARSDLARHEGLLVRIDTPMTVSGTHELARYGSLALSSGGRLFRPTNAPALSAADNERRRLVLDDGSYRAWPQPVPYLDAQGTRRVGSSIDALEGILTHAFEAWRLHPLDTDAIDFSDTNPRPTPPPRTDVPRIAGFNVENYFLTLGRRGAADDGELAQQRARLGAVAAGLAADLLGLVEVENRPAVGADLAQRLGTAAGIDGGYRHFGLETAVGSDAIRVMLAWDPARVALIAGPFIDDDPVHHRPPLAGHFRLGDDGPGKLVVVVHHKAKSGCPRTGDIDRGQGCWNLRRTEQSRALAAFLAGLQRETGTDRVLIIGDINSYGEEDPLRVLREAGYIDLVARDLAPEARYSYVFRGESGYLDHALATPALAESIEDVRFWHINADEPAALHAISDSGPPVGPSGPWRSSDHDPILLELTR